MNFSIYLYSAILFLNGIDKNITPATCKDVNHAKFIVKTAQAITGYKDRCDDVNNQLTNQFILLNCKLSKTSNKQTATEQRHEYCPKLAEYLFHNNLLQNSSIPEVTILPSRENAEQLYTKLQCSAHGDIYITSSCKKSNAVTINLNLDIKDL